MNFKYMVWILKLLLTLVIAYFLYQRLFVKNNLFELWDSFQVSFDSTQYLYFFLAILLMPLNWFLESEKWRSLMNQFIDISNTQAYKSILIGVSFGFVTPNRLGEYGGRILTVDKKYNWLAVLSTMISSLAQNIITLLIGFIGISILSKHIFTSTESAQFWTIGIVMITFLLLVFFIFLKPILKRLSKLELIKSRKKLLRNISEATKLPKKIYFNVLLLSLLRYLIYSIQYALILLFFNASLAFGQLFSGIATIFLIQTGMPLPPIMNVMARGEIALNIWATYGVNEITVLLATFCLWILNLVIPALFGLILTLRLNIIKSFGLK